MFIKLSRKIIFIEQVVQNNIMSGLRQKVQRLKKYQIFKLFSFIELSYLAQNYHQQTFIFKQYLYTQGSCPSQIYLIEQGEFQITTLFSDNEEKQIRNKLKQRLHRDKKINKEKNQASDFQESSLYSVQKPSKKKQLKIRTIVGGLGQSIGEQETILNKQKRRYNAKCASTHNKVIVIKRQHLRKIFQQNPQLLDNLKSQLSQKQKITNQAYHKLKSLRSNRESLAKLLFNQSSSKEKYNSQSTQRLSEDKSVKLPLIQRKNLTQMRKKQEQKKEKSILRNSNDSLKSNKKNYDDPSSQSDIGGSFMLTALDHPNTQVIKRSQTKFSKFKQLTIDKIALIQEEKKPVLKSSKSQNANEMSPQTIFNKQKLKGIIDSTALVKQKQRILQMKKNPNQINERTQFQQRQIKMWKQNLLEKERTKKASTAHSKQYMEKMLLTALKKAGYHQAIPQIQKSSERGQHKKSLTQVSHLSNFQGQSHVEEAANSTTNGQTKKLKLEKIALKIKKKRKAFFEPVTQILESNPFDECYFSKMK